MDQLTNHKHKIDFYNTSLIWPIQTIVKNVNMPKIYKTTWIDGPIIRFI